MQDLTPSWSHRPLACTAESELELRLDRGEPLRSPRLVGELEQLGDRPPVACRYLDPEAALGDQLGQLRAADAARVPRVDLATAHGDALRSDVRLLELLDSGGLRLGREEAHLVAPGIVRL